MNILEYINKKNNNLKNLIRTVKNDLATVNSLSELNNSNNYDSYIKIQNNLIQQYGGVPGDVVFRSGKKRNINMEIAEDKSGADNNNTIYYYIKDGKVYIPNQNVHIPSDFKDSDNVKLKLFEIQHYINELKKKKTNLQTKLDKIETDFLICESLNNDIKTLKKSISSLNGIIKKLTEANKAKKEKKIIEEEKLKGEAKKLEEKLKEEEKEEKEVMKGEEKIKELKELFKDATNETNLDSIQKDINSIIPVFTTIKTNLTAKVKELETNKDNLVKEGEKKE